MENMQVDQEIKDEKVDNQETFTQEQVNMIMGKVRREVSAKYADYDDYKAKAQRLDEIEAQSKSELEKAQERAMAAEKKLEHMQAEKKRLDIASKVSKDTGIPVELLHGDDEEALAASAAAIADFVKSKKPTFPTDKGGAATAEPWTRESILAVKDAAKRKKLISENSELF